MRLESDAVDRHAAGLEVGDHVIDAVTLGVEAVGAEVVVTEFGVRVGGSGGAERLFDPAVAELLLEVRLATAAVPLEGFVDHVPGLDVSGPVPGDTVDVVDHGLPQVVPGQSLDPAGLLCVPDQCVAADLHAAGLGVGDDLVATAEVELPRIRLRGVPLHHVLGDQAVEVAVERGRVGRVVEEVRDDGGPEVPAALGRGGSERPGGLGGPGGHHEPGRSGQGCGRGGGDGRPDAAPSPR